MALGALVVDFSFVFLDAYARLCFFFAQCHLIRCVVRSVSPVVGYANSHVVLVSADELK